jgi:hypothetical protein
MKIYVLLPGLFRILKRPGKNNAACKARYIHDRLELLVMLYSYNNEGLAVLI